MLGKSWRWRRAGNIKKVIVVVSDQRYGKGKLKGLYDNGFYDALFEKNFFGIDIVELALKGRDAKAAYEYYGLKEYRDPMASSVDVVEVVSEPDSVEETEREKEDREEDKPGKESKKSEKGNKKAKGTERKKTESEAEEQPKQPEGKKERKKAGRAEDTSEEAGGAEEEYHKGETDEDELLTPVASLSSELDVISRQHEIEEAMYMDDGEVDFSKGIASFLKKGVDISEYLKAMDETASVDTRTVRELSEAERVEEDILHYYTTEESGMMGNLERGYTSRAQWSVELMERIESYTQITEAEQKEILVDFNRFMFGYDHLEEFLMDPEVTDIKMLDYDSVQIKREGKRIPVTGVFRSPEHYCAFIEHLAKRNHKNLQRKGVTTFVDTRSFENVRLRVNIATERVNLNGMPSLEIRKHNNKKYTTQELVNKKMFTEETAAYFIYQISHLKSMVVVGGNAQGKTSFVNWLIDYLPRESTGLFLQEEDELWSKTHRFLKFQRIIKDPDELEDDEEAYDLKKLMAKGLKTDNDAFGISEITGEEAKFFVNACSTGSCCITTTHGEDEKMGLVKIADYATYDSKYTQKDFMRMLRGINLVVYIEDFQVKRVAEVGEWIEEKGDYVYNKVDIKVPVKPKKKGKSKGKAA